MCERNKRKAGIWLWTATAQLCSAIANETDFRRKFTCHSRRLRESYVHSKHVYIHSFTHPPTPILRVLVSLLKARSQHRFSNFRCTSIDRMKFQKLHKHFVAKVLSALPFSSLHIATLRVSYSLWISFVLMLVLAELPPLSPFDSIYFRGDDEHTKSHSDVAFTGHGYTAQQLISFLCVFLCAPSPLRTHSHTHTSPILLCHSPFLLTRLFVSLRSSHLRVFPIHVKWTPKSAQKQYPQHQQERPVILFRLLKHSDQNLMLLSKIASSTIRETEERENEKRFEKFFYNENPHRAFRIIHLPSTI